MIDLWELQILCAKGALTFYVNIGEVGVYTSKYIDSLDLGPVLR